MTIRKATLDDLAEIDYIYEEARRFMVDVGNPHQWNNRYPDSETVINDINCGNLYLCVEDETVLAVFCFFIGLEPTYINIYDGCWLDDMEYGVIHRVAVAPNSHGKGVASKCFDYCYQMINNLKIDTHEDNLPMQKALLKNGFKRCGRIMVSNGERIAFQKNNSQ